MNKACPKIIGKNLTVAYGDYVLLQHADFTVNQGDVFIIMGASGGGKSSLLRVLTGLMPPAEGEVLQAGQLEKIFVAINRHPMRVQVMPAGRAASSTETA